MAELVVFRKLEHYACTIHDTGAESGYPRAESVFAEPEYFCNIAEFLFQNTGMSPLREEFVAGHNNKYNG